MSRIHICLYFSSMSDTVILPVCNTVQHSGVSATVTSRYWSIPTLGYSYTENYCVLSKLITELPIFFNTCSLYLSMKIIY